MKRGMILELVPRDGFDNTTLGEALLSGRPVDLSNYEIHQHVSVIDSFRQEFLDYLAKYGLPSFLKRGTLLEDVVAPGTSPSGIEQLLHAFIKSISATTDLVIVDPYFFAPTHDANYPTLITNVLQPLLPTLITLTVVTLPNKIDTTLANSIKANLISGAKNLSVTHKTSTSFHDRFWINPANGAGFICGTSLNGLGRKYALVDNLEPSDAVAIVAALRSELLL